MLWAWRLYSPVRCSWSRILLSADLNGLAQIHQFMKLLYSFHFSRVSRFIGALLARCSLHMVAEARTGSKNFSAVSSPIFIRDGSKYCHHYISCRCSSHVVLDAGIGWWRILMIMAHRSLVYMTSLRNLRRSQKENVVAILLL